MRADDVIQERYRLETPLGRGGMAEVWRALDERLRRPVAIKFLTSRYTEDPEFLVRFFSEAQAVAAISHANVVRVLDFGMADAGPYLVMELVEGGALDDLTGAPLGVAEACRLVRQAAEGAGAAHDRGIVHRDLKPGNILLTPAGDVKLADFGIATLGSIDHLAATGTAIGSPHYISPEGACGEAVSPASDVYSLGVVLYELLTGVRPFEADSATAVALAHVEAEPEPPSGHRSDLPAWIDALVLTCLAKEPGGRFADGRQLAAALRAGEGDAPLIPAIPSAPRRPVAPKLAASVACLTVLGLGGFLLAAPDSTIPTPSAAAADGSSMVPAGPPRPSVSPTERDQEEAEIGVTAVPAGADEPAASPTPSPERDEDEDEQGEETTGEVGSDEDTDSEPVAEEPVEEEEPEEEPQPEETVPPEEEEPPAEEEPSPGSEEGSETEGEEAP